MNFQALGELSLKYLSNIKDLDKESFLKYFSDNLMLTNEEKLKNILSVDLKYLTQKWPSVVTNLKKDKNLYNHLKKIFYEALLHMSAITSDYGLLQNIIDQCPEVNVNIPNKQGLTIKDIAIANNDLTFLNKLSSLFVNSSATEFRDIAILEEKKMLTFQ